MSRAPPNSTALGDRSTISCLYNGRQEDRLQATHELCISQLIVVLTLSQSNLPTFGHPKPGLGLLSVLIRRGGRLGKKGG